MGFLASEQKEKTCPACGARVSVSANFCNQCGKNFREEPKIGFIANPVINGRKGEYRSSQAGFLAEVEGGETSRRKETIGFLAEIPNIKYFRGIKDAQKLTELRDVLKKVILEETLEKIGLNSESEKEIKEAYIKELNEIEKEYDFLMEKLPEELLDDDDDYETPGEKEKLVFNFLLK